MNRKSRWATIIGVVCGAELVVIAVIGGAGVAAFATREGALIAAVLTLAAFWVFRERRNARSAQRASQAGSADNGATSSERALDRSRRPSELR